MADDGPSAPGTRSGPHVDARLVRELLAEQHPDLADRPLRRGPSGWDNHLWRLGDDLAVRVPRRATAVPLVANEQRWLPVVAGLVDVAVPVPVRNGRAGSLLDVPWSVVPWLSGGRLDRAPGVGARIVDDLARFLAELHVPAPRDAPHNPHRSVPLGDRAEPTGIALDALRRDPTRAAVTRRDLDVAAAAFDAGVAAAPHRGSATWIHGDLHPGNVLVRGGRLAAVVDWGDVAAGDPAADLAVRWWAVPGRRHAALVAALPAVEAAAWTRAAGWAASIALYLLDQGPRAGDAALTAVGRRTLRRLGGASG